ncbi:DUF4145 domain-containing protein [Kitasatospora sp. NPDC057904]|uniref:DUF4145 domain-containing protein n=1 Tax=Kitasatospora sp. NPDC057904 TaxID=3346275 RepID=UPI0036DE821D
MEEDYGDGWDGEPIAVWPGRTRSTNHLIPPALWQEQDEARRCFSSKAYTAAVVMVRRTLEGVCAEHNVMSPRGGLVKGLEQLKELGKIDERLLAWAQALRVLGNEGAHYTGKMVSPEDAADALALCDALLDYLYVYAAQFEKFQERRLQRGISGKAPAANSKPVGDA